MRHTHPITADSFVADQSGDTNSFAGPVTMASTLAVTGAITASAGITGDIVGEVTGTAPVEVVTTTNAITAAESGKTFFLNSATGFVSTLPAPAAGLNFTFIIGATPPTSGNHTVVTTSNATIIQGNVLHNPTDDAGTRGDDEDTITFVASQAVEGDWVHVISDGTNWYVRGQANVTEGVTLTDAA